MQRRIKKCGYCGKPADRLEREHVIPRCLYPDSKAKSRVQRLTVFSCGDCNRGWSDDEAHFRNVLLVAGEPNAAVQELWTTTARRSFKQSDGHRRLRDLTALMEPVQLDGKDRWMIYPARDERVLRVIKKIVRGLSHHHGVESALPETRITADVMKFRIPDEFLKEIQFQHRESDIIQYWYEIFEDGVTSSVWLLNFFKRRMFIAWVSRSEEGGPG